MSVEPVKKRTALAAKIAVALLIMLFFGTVVLNFIYFRYGNEDSFDPIIFETAARHNIDPLMIKAIIKRESRFQYRSVGSKGEIGLMQLMPGAVQDWERIHKKSYKKTEIFKPSINIEIGTWYFAQARSHWRKSANPDAYALAQYNAGRGNVLRWVKKLGSGEDYDKVVQFPSTREYIKVILEYYQEYCEERGDERG